MDREEVQKIKSAYETVREVLVNSIPGATIEDLDRFESEVGKKNAIEYYRTAVLLTKRYGLKEITQNHLDILSTDLNMPRLVITNNIAKPVVDLGDRELDSVGLAVRTGCLGVITFGLTYLFLVNIVPLFNLRSSLPSIYIPIICAALTLTVCCTSIYSSFKEELKKIKEME